jgi:hypothetical protein
MPMWVPPESTTCEYCGRTKPGHGPHQCVAAMLIRRFSQWIHVTGNLETALYAYERSGLCVRDRFHVE